MISKEIAKKIHKKLDRLFPEVEIPLKHVDPFTLLVAVVLSARCTDAKVNQVTPELFALAKTPEAIAKLPVATIQKIIKPCGLSPAKARAISGLSKIISEKHGGNVPRTFEELEALPGVGHKTASVVMVQAFDVPAFPVDTHIHRLAQMWNITSGKNTKQSEEDLKQTFPKKSWNKLHLQMIYYGRSYCQSRGCDGLRCVMCQECFPERTRAFKAKKQ